MYSLLLVGPTPTLSLERIFISDNNWPPAVLLAIGNMLVELTKNVLKLLISCLLNNVVVVDNIEGYLDVFVRPNASADNVSGKDKPVFPVDDFVDIACSKTTI